MNFIVYLHHQKEVALLTAEDIMLGEYSDFEVEDWRKIGGAEARVTVIYEDEPCTAFILMCVPNTDDDCEALLSKLRAVIRNKRFTAKNLVKFCGTRVKPAATRTKVHPLQILQTEPSDLSDADLLDSEPNTREPATVPALPSLPPLPMKASTPRKSLPQLLEPEPSFMSDMGSLNSERNTREPTGAPSLPPPLARGLPSLTASTPRNSFQQASTSSGSVEMNYVKSIGKTYEHLLSMCDRMGIHRESKEADRFFMTCLIKENMSLKSEVRNLSQRIAALESTRVQSVPVTEMPDAHQFPVFKTIDEYLDIENHPQNMKSWMIREGGATPKDHIYRVMAKLLHPDLIAKINRPGLYGKHSFFPSLEEHLKQSTLGLFKNVDAKSVEVMVSKFFNGARDRNGGRDRRRKNTGEKEVMAGQPLAKRVSLTYFESAE